MAQFRKRGGEGLKTFQTGGGRGDRGAKGPKKNSHEATSLKLSYTRREYIGGFKEEVAQT